MSAYVISEVDVRDAAGFETYRTIAAKSIAQYGRPLSGSRWGRECGGGWATTKEHHRR